MGRDETGQWDGTISASGYVVLFCAPFLGISSILVPSVEQRPMPCVQRPRAPWRHHCSCGCPRPPLTVTGVIALAPASLSFSAHVPQAPAAQGPSQPHPAAQGPLWPHSAAELRDRLGLNVPQATTAPHAAPAVQQDRGPSCPEQEVSVPLWLSWGRVLLPTAPALGSLPAPTRGTLQPT